MTRTAATWGPYTLGELLHTGAESCVFRARAADGRPVILKRSRSEPTRAREAGRLHHEHAVLAELGLRAGLVEAIGLAEHDGTLGLVLADPGARSLEALLAQRGALPWAQAVRLVRQLAATLDLVHQVGVVHKDVKPQNILVDEAAEQVWLIDFGIASRLAFEATAPLVPEALEGTLAYISPEQTGRTARALDARADLYSLGVTLYQLVSGALPFTEQEPLALVHAHLAHAPRPLPAHVPPAVQAIVERLLAKDPENRYQTARGLAADLDRALEGGPAFPLGQRDFSPRLRLPNLVIGREDATATLRAAFERASQGAVEVLLIGGPSGIGKTALVRSVYREIAALGRGNLLAGKHDQLAQSVPYAALSQAIAELMGQIAASPAAAFDGWRARIVEKVGPPVRALADLIPELEWVVGKQPELERGTAEMASNLLRVAWLDLVEVVREQSPPLVLFLDDLQWADPASWSTLETILTDGHQKNLLVIGAYRDNETPAGHPLWKLMSRVEESGVSTSQVAVGPLDEAMVRQWLAVALQTAPERTAPLAAALHTKTAGNPFFLGQLLLDQHRQRRVWRDLETGAWAWDLPAIEASGATDNVLELMSGMVRELPPATQSLLGHAACAGHHLSLREAAVLTGLGAPAVAEALWPALVAGLVIPADSGYREAQALARSASGHDVDAQYRFAHDRMQQACYERIAPEQRARTHWSVGQRLRAHYEAHRGGDKDLLELVRHLDLGSSVLETSAERVALAELELRAARAAKNNGVFRLQAALVESAQALLGEHAWRDHAALCVELGLERLESAFLLREFDALQQHAVALLAHDLPRLARLTTHELRARSYIAAGAYEDTERVGVEALTECGLVIPPVDEHTVTRAVEAFLALDAHPDDIATFPAETSAERPVLESLQVQTMLGMAFGKNPMRAPLALAALVRHILDARTVTVVSAYAFSGIAQVRSAMLGTYRASMRWAQAGYDVAVRLRSPLIPECAAYVGVYTAYSRHVEHCREHYRAGMSAGIASGLFQGYSWNLLSEVLFLDWWSGRPLPELAEKVRASRESASKRADAVARFGLDLCDGAAQFLAEPLQGRPAEDDGWMGAASSAAFATRNAQIAANACVIEALLFLMLDEPRAALARAEYTEAIRPSLYGTPNVTDVPLWLGLAAAQCWSAAQPDDERARLMKHLDHAIERFRYFTDGCAENFGHKLRLLEAEKARIEGRLADALLAYDDAIEQARAQGFLPIEALAAQLAFAFHLGAGRRRLASQYLTHACDTYTRWGAHRVVHHLRKSHFELLPASDGTSGDATVHAGASEHRTVARTVSRSTTHLTMAGTRTVDTLDVDVAIRSAQALSSELSSAKVVARLMELVLESTGAQRAALLLGAPTALRLVARLDVSRAERVQTGLSIALAEGADVSPAMIELVARTRRVLLLADARQDPRFREDRHLIRAGTRAALVSPILQQGQVVGVLLMEHAEPHAFTQARVAQVGVLASQAAVALENAKLYDQLRALNEGLEATVAQRTAELQRALSELWGEMDLATKIQTVLLPPDGRYAGYEIAATMRPTDNVGGDYYDVVESGGRTWVMIGDVSGHGVSAGLVMMMVQTAIRTALHALHAAGEAATPSRVLALVNAAVWPNLKRIGKGQYMTLAALCLAGDEVTFAGQHLDLLVHRADARHVERIETDGIFLGVIERVSMADQTFRLGAGDTLLLWTDGVSEARTASGALLGQPAIEAWLAEHAGAASCRALVDGMVARLEGATLTDDVTLLALRRG